MNLRKYPLVDPLEVAQEAPQVNLREYPLVDPLEGPRAQVPLAAHHLGLLNLVLLWGLLQAHLLRDLRHRVMVLEPR